MRIIDADALREEILKHMPTGGSRSVFLSFVDDAPTIEAVPVHGEWILDMDEYDVEFAECSVCKEEFYNGENDTFDIHPNFCPNCGADMRKKV